MRGTTPRPAQPILVQTRTPRRFKTPSRKVPGLPQEPPRPPMSPPPHRDPQDPPEDSQDASKAVSRHSEDFPECTAHNVMQWFPSQGSPQDPSKTPSSTFRQGERLRQKKGFELPLFDGQGCRLPQAGHTSISTKNNLHCAPMTLCTTCAFVETCWGRFSVQFGSPRAPGWP